MPNADQIEYWDGPAGEHWVAEEDRYDRFNIRFGERIVGGLDAEPGERVLDVGCGNGALCLAIAPVVAPGGRFHGLDVSGPMLAAAARRAGQAGLDNVTFEKGDAQVHPGPFSLAELERIRAVLTAFTDITIDEVIAPMRLGDTTDDVVEFMQRTDMAQTLMKDVDDDTASAAWRAVSEALGPYASPDGVTLHGAAWLVEARRPD